MRLANRIKTVQKYLLSFLKKKWEFNDYPIFVREQSKGPIPFGWEFHAWVASIINWHVGGTGNTKEEALISLRSNFEKYKTSNPKLPRPGKLVRLQFAATDRIDKYPETLKIFTEKILKMTFAFISNDSTLNDFETGNRQLQGTYLAAIKKEFQLDVSDIPNGNIGDILERISKVKDKNHP